MDSPADRDHILAAMAERAEEIHAYVSQLPAAALETGTSAAWGVSHHLAHLASGHGRLTRAFRTRDLLPRQAGVPSRGYAAVRDAYRAALALAPKDMLARNATTGAVEAGTTHMEVLGRYASAASELRRAAQEWNETELDERLIPHPLLGPLPAREMLWFMLYHDLHHLEGMRAVVAAQSGH